jgi:prefoldin subunit 5
MNAEAVKKVLIQLYDKEDFEVQFSGKKSKQVNGFYKPIGKQIVINNLNFVREDGSVNDSLLIHTAIHELAHHVLNTPDTLKLKRPHDQVFWATFYDLLDRAESKGIYKQEIDEETQSLIDEAQSISREIAALQRKLGAVLIKIESVCEQKGLRKEDVIERKAQITVQTAKKVAKAAHLNLPETAGVDVQDAVLREKDADKQAALISAAQTGKALVQAKQGATKPAPQKDETVFLTKEKHRLERTIEHLNRRLEEVSRQLEEL